MHYVADLCMWHAQHPRALLPSSCLECSLVNQTVPCRVLKAESCKSVSGAFNGMALAVLTLAAYSRDETDVTAGEMMTRFGQLRPSTCGLC